MGKPRMDLLKGIGEQEQAINKSKIYSEDTQSETVLESQKPKNTLIEEKVENNTNTKPQRQSFSFRADQDKIETWKLYAETIGAKDIGTLWTAAIDEYINNHKLTEDQQVIYNLKKKAVEMQKNQK